MPWSWRNREVTAVVVGDKHLVIGHTGFVSGPGIFLQQVVMEHLTYSVLGPIPGARDSGQDRLRTGQTPVS